MARIVKLDVLLLANILPVALHLWGAPYARVALAYAAGNSIWIALLFKGGRTVDDDEGLPHAWIPVLVMVAGAFSWAWLAERPGTVAGGFGWDGRQYAAIHSHFAHNTFWPIVPEFPFAQRVAMPWAAAHLPLDGRGAFRVLHLIFWFSTMALFAAWCRAVLCVRTAWIFAAVLWLQILWLSVPRATAAYAFGVDSATVFFTELWIVLLTSRRARPLLPLCAFAGVFFKESMLLVVLLTLLAMGVLRWLSPMRPALPGEWRRLRSASWLSLLAAAGAGAVGKIMAARVLGVPPGAHNGEIAVLAQWWAMRTRHPVYETLRYVAAIFSVYGGFLLLRVSTIGRPSGERRSWIVHLLGLISACYLVVCVFAGSDLSRFAFLGFPFALPALMLELDEVPPAFAMTALLLGVPAAHLFAGIPSPLPQRAYPNLDLDGVYSWMMEYAHAAIVGSWLAWWLGAIVLLRSVAFSRTWRLARARPLRDPGLTRGGAPSSDRG